MRYALILLAGLLFSTFIETQAETKTKPNILLIITDQQTADAMSCVGNPSLKTPAMDRLAESGVLFSNNYVTQPLCLPWRSSMQTGRYPHEIGTISNGLPIKGEFPLLGKLVNAAGYDCHYIGKWHIGVSQREAGYPGYEKGGKDPEKTVHAIKYLKSNHKKPFFLTVSLMNPHNVCQLARADADGSDLPDGPIAKSPTELEQLPPLPNNFDVPENEPTVLREIQEKSPYHYPTAQWDERTWRQYLWGYYRLVEKVDTQIGQILDALEEGGYAKNTVVIFTSDHGEGVARHHWNQKQILYDQSVKTPFIINWPGHTQKRKYTELVSNALDIAPTILELCGSEIPASMPGQSLVPVMMGESPNPRDYVISETMFARGTRNLGATGRMIRTKTFKYCIYDNGEKREQLFDMINDPGETRNLVMVPEFADELDQHRRLITAWARETKDDAFPYIQP